MQKLNAETVIRTIGLMRSFGTDLQRWEVRAAEDGLPPELLKTISAFANTHGGTIILGLSAENGFRPAEGFNAEQIYAQMQTIGAALTPVICMQVDQIYFEDSLLVAAKVSALPRHLKPCYITNAGRYEGSFMRSGDGNRHLTAYEVDRLAEFQYQPPFDIEPVEAASVDDLDADIIEGIVSRARELFPQVFGKQSRETLLLQLGVLTQIDQRLCPTLAGLLVAGTFPQQYFPRLEIVFSVYPGTTKAEAASGQLRYLNSKEIIGSIPEMILETLALVQQRMNTGAVIEGGLRRDLPDYALAAVREAVVNALQHRDYSPEGRGSQIQVNMYADRLEILSPGGLYGAVTAESLGKAGISATRNAYLSRLLAYTPFFASGFVAATKGTGFMEIEDAQRKLSLPPPIIKDSLTYFSLTFPKSDLTTAALTARAWENIDQAILTAVSGQGSLSVQDLVQMSGLSRSTIGNHVRQLVADHKLSPTEPKGSPRQRYRLGALIA